MIFYLFYGKLNKDVDVIRITKSKLEQIAMLKFLLYRTFRERLTDVWHKYINMVIANHQQCWYGVV